MSMTVKAQCGGRGKRRLVTVKRIPIVLDGENLGGRFRRGFSRSGSGSGRIVGFEESNADDEDLQPTTMQHPCLF